MYEIQIIFFLFPVFLLLRELPYNEKGTKRARPMFPSLLQPSRTNGGVEAEEITPKELQLDAQWAKL